MQFLFTNTLILALRRTLANHVNYRPTTITWLQRLREDWIPIVIHDVEDETRIAHEARKVLEGKCPEFRDLTAEKRIAIAMLACQVWADSLVNQNLDEDMEKNLVQYLSIVPAHHAMLALRNAGGGKETPVAGICIRRMGKKNDLWVPLFRNHIYPKCFPKSHV